MTTTNAIDARNIAVSSPPVIFLCKGQKLKKKLVDIRENNLIFRVLDNKFAVAIIAMSGLFFQPVVETNWPIVLTFLVLSPIIQWFMTLDFPKYIEVDNVNITFHNTNKRVSRGDTQSSSLGRMVALGKLIEEMPIRDIKKVELLYSDAFKCDRIRLRDGYSWRDFDCKLSAKSRKQFVDYFSASNIAFEDLSKQS